MSEVTLALIVVGALIVIGMIFGYVLRMVEQEYADTRIKKLINWGIEQALEQSKKYLPNKEPLKPKYAPPPKEEIAARTQQNAPPPVMAPMPPTNPKPDVEAVATLRKARLRPVTVVEEIEEMLAAYDPKKVRAALLRMQVRAGGKKAKI